MASWSKFHLELYYTIPTSKVSAAIPKIVIFIAYKLNDLYHDLNLVKSKPIEAKSYKKKGN